MDRQLLLHFTENSCDVEKTQTLVSKISKANNDSLAESEIYGSSDSFSSLLKFILHFFTLRFEDIVSVFLCLRLEADVIIKENKKSRYNEVIDIVIAPSLHE